MVNNMEQHDFLQGSPEWHQHRATHFNASDAPAMLGISAYESRTALIERLATGITPEVDAATQRRFDDGHRFEALARPLAEQIIGKKLYPVIGTEGRLSASFDGLTMDESICFEHKTLNNELRKAEFDEIGYYLPEQYRAQMEQQLMVSAAGKCLFMASKFDVDDQIIEERHCWYVIDQAMRERIMYGWTQLSIDIEEYHRKLAVGEIKTITEKPKAEVCIELPALFVHARGEITEHNMEAFGVALTAKLAEVRAIALVTDQDFSNAKEAAKKFRETAKAIALSKEAMLAQTETIGEAARKMDAWVKDLNGTALQLEKDVEREDKAKKEVMVLEGRQAYADHITALEAEIKPIRITLAPPNFAEAIKGKRNYASMQEAIDTMLRDGKFAADQAAKDFRAKLAWCKENTVGYGALFPDLQALMVKPMEDFTLTITSRIEKQKADEAARLEAQRAAMQAEEEAKARAKVEEEQRQAAAKAEAEQEKAALDKHFADRAAAEAQEAAAIEERRKTMQVAESAQAIRPPVASKVTRINPAANPAARPSDKEIVDAVAAKFGVSLETACVWIVEAAEAITTKEAA